MGETQNIQSRANDENWTRDLFLTKEALYPWAKSAEKFYLKLFKSLKLSITN